MSTVAQTLISRPQTQARGSREEAPASEILLSLRIKHIDYLISLLITSILTFIEKHFSLCNNNNNSKLDINKSAIISLLYM